MASDAIPNVKTTPKGIPVVDIQPKERANIQKIGFAVDSWADIVEGKASIAPEVTQTTLQLLTEKKMPHITLTPIYAHTGRIREIVSTISNFAAPFINRFKPSWAGNEGDLYEERPALIANTAPGITTAIFIRPHGTDLHISWRTHVTLVWNWKLILVLFIASLVPIGLCTGCSLFLSSAVNGWVEASIMPKVNEVTTSLSDTFSNPNSSSTTQILEISTADFPSTLGNILQAVGGTFTVWLVMFVALCIALTFFGYIIHGHALYFFLVEPTVFDAEDAVALSLTTHKTLLQALEIHEVKVKELLPHTIFKGSRRSL